MFRFVSAVVVATLSLNAIAAEPPAVTHARPQLIALQTERAATTPASATLDDYAGVYATVDGALFVVVHDGDSLAIELPENLALPIRATETSFVVDASVMRIAFEKDAVGQERLVVSGSSAQPIVATRVPLRRGVVTIHDL